MEVKTTMLSKIADFLKTGSLYGKGLSINIEDIPELTAFLEKEYRIDCYCPSCGDNSTFLIHKTPKKNSVNYNPGSSKGNKIMIDRSNELSDKETAFEAVETEKDITRKLMEKQLSDLLNKLEGFHPHFHCARDDEHVMNFCLFVKDKQLIKYGQYPSLAELNISRNSKKYRNLLQNYYIDYNTGVQLFAYGIGAGSLIYLRRVFEKLIDEARLTAESEANLKSDYHTLRMDEKIKHLSNYLPDYLVENRKIYRILSKGIHELPEDTCKKIFPAVQAGIELILDEKIEKEDREKKKKEISLSLAELETELSNESI